MRWRRIDLSSMSGHRRLVWVGFEIDWMLFSQSSESVWVEATQESPVATGWIAQSANMCNSEQALVYIWARIYIIGECLHTETWATRWISDVTQRRIILCRNRLVSSVLPHRHKSTKHRLHTGGSLWYEMLRYAGWIEGLRTRFE